MIDAQALATILMVAAHMEPEGDEMDSFWKHMENIWDDMTSAPKNGTRFLASDGRNSFVCSWGSLYMRDAKGDVSGWINPDGQIGNHARPIKWMPLPPSEVPVNG